MARTIEINGRKYRFPEIDFNAVCDLADKGVDIMNPKTIIKKPIPAARAIVAWIFDTDIETAGAEIQSHILAGGDLAPIFEVMNSEVEESGFFKSLLEREESAKLNLQDHKKKQKSVQENTEA